MSGDKKGQRCEHGILWPHECKDCLNGESSRSPAGYGETRGSVIAMLVAVARASHNLADNTCEESGTLTVNGADFDELSKALDALDELPEPGITITGTGPAKAEALLAS